MTDIEIINEQIKSRGLNPHGQPLYRIVWSDYQTEKRFGRFNVFASKIFLHEFVGVKEVPKYNYIIERWILERWFPPELAYNHEVPASSQGDYIPLYVFQDKFMNPLPVVQKVVDRIIYMAENPIHRTEEEITNELLEKEDKEIEVYMDSLEISPITNALQMKEAVGYTKEVK